jgi:hypothetical protein
MLREMFWCYVNFSGQFFSEESDMRYPEHGVARFNAFTKYYENPDNSTTIPRKNEA